MAEVACVLDRLALIPQRCFAVMFMMMLFVGEEVAAQQRGKAVLGIGAAFVPRFQGADEHEALPVPLMDVRKGRFFARTEDGIGMDLIETPRFTVGTSVAWMPGYDEDDVPEGIGELSDALGGKVFVSTRLGGTVTTLSATRAITERERGLLAGARIAYPQGVTERLTVVPSLAVYWVDDKYMNTYFGVDSSRAVRSGLNPYQPSAGFKDVSLRLALRYRISGSWDAIGAVGVARLFDKAADSPFVERRVLSSAVVGFTYRF